MELIVPQSTGYVSLVWHIKMRLDTEP